MTANIDRLAERLGRRVRTLLISEFTMTCSRKNRDFVMTAFRATGKKMTYNGLVFYTEVPETTVCDIRWREKSDPTVWKSMAVYAGVVGGYVYNFPGGMRTGGFPEDLSNDIYHLVEMFENQIDRLPAT